MRTFVEANLLDLQILLSYGSLFLNILHQKAIREGCSWQLPSDVLKTFSAS